MTVEKKIKELVAICEGVYEDDDVKNILREIAQWQREQCAKAWNKADIEINGPVLHAGGSK